MEICVAFNEERTDFGLFYIKSNYVCFPYEGWEDFHVSILTHWTQELLKNDRLDFAEMEISFMEGAYGLLCQKQGDWVTVIGKQDGNQTFENAFSEKLLYSELKSVVYRAAQTIIKAFDYEHKEIKELSALAEKLVL